MTDACETPMSDHIAEFWHLLETEHVRILIDIRRSHEPGSGVMYHWDSASFPDDTAKAIAADHRAAQPQYLANCQLGGACHGQCESTACTNYGKAIVVRRCVEPKQDGVVYPEVET